MSSKGLSQLSSYKQPIATMIVRVFDEIEAELPPLSRHATWALDTLRQYSLRDSKRVRGSLAAAMYDHAVGGERTEAGLRLAVAIELIQNHLLIVDDVMDRSLLRRGQPTVHELYKSAYPSSDDHEANMVGVLVGMMVQHAANLALVSTGVDPRNCVEAFRVVQRHTLITDIGQIDDSNQSFGRAVSRDDLIRKYEQKSSYYSFVDPLQAALALAGKNGAGVARDCEAFGLPAGVAFQIQDDYLGIFGAIEDTGKPNLDDIHEGKHTLMVQSVIETGAVEDKAVLSRIIGNIDADTAELAIIRELFTTTGAATSARHTAQEYADQAIAAARAADSWSPDFADVLADLVTFAVEREK